MITTLDTSTAAIGGILRELNYPAHRLGYSYLIAAVELYAQYDVQCLSKELYPAVAARFGYSDWRPIEHAIRSVTLDTWDDGDRQAWAYYFPGCRKVPSNKQLIATLAEHLQQRTPPYNRRG